MSGRQILGMSFRQRGEPMSTLEQEETPSIVIECMGSNDSVKILSQCRDVVLAEE